MPVIPQFHTALRLKSDEFSLKRLTTSPLAGAHPFSTSTSITGPDKSGTFPASKDPRILPHLTPSSEVHQISVSHKPPTHRTALAIGHVKFSNAAPLKLIRSHSLKKGDVLAVARVAGIQAVKKTADIIPLAHGGVGVEGCTVHVQPVGTMGEENLNEKLEAISTKASEKAFSEERRVINAMRLQEGIGEFGGVRLAVMVETTAKTGIEMEALTGVMGAALTVVDMVKGVDRDVGIDGVKVGGKKGGKSGGWGVWDQTDSRALGK